jgi:hypothetical protein
MSNKPRDLHMPAAVLVLAHLSWSARHVLTEIIDLYKVNGMVFASDEHFVNRLPGTSLRTIQGAIKELVEEGYVTRETNQRAQHKRILTPTSKQDGISPAKSAGDHTDLPQILREPTADSAADLSQILHEAPANFADINTSLNTTGNTNQTLTPRETKKNAGVGEFSEETTPSLRAETQLVPPVAESPQPKVVAAAQLPEALATEAKMLANQIGQLWHITEIRNQPKWARIHTFCRRLAVLGRLTEVQQQFAGYRLQRDKARIRPHQLDTWLGKPADDFADGEWCGCDWAAVAADTRTRPCEQQPVQPARATTSSLTKARQQQDW